MVKELSQANVKEVLEAESKPYLLEFYTPWCGVCQQVMPFVEEIATEHDDTYAFYKANAEEMLDFAKQYDVRSVPTLLFIKDGEVKNKHHGFITKEDIVAKLKESF